MGIKHGYMIVNVISETTSLDQHLLPAPKKLGIVVDSIQGIGAWVLK